VKVDLKVVNVARKKTLCKKMNHGDAEDTEKNKLCALCGLVVRKWTTETLRTRRKINSVDFVAQWWENEPRKCWGHGEK